MAGHYASMKTSKHFPALPQFSGFMKPCRFEGEVRSLEVHGTIPDEIDGTFYRVMPDPQFPPFIENDPWFNGDGMVSAFRIHNGAVDFKQRYVQTEKFKREREAQRALIGKYRNKYTDAVAFKIRTTSNTNIIYFNGRLLACKEDAPPYAMDPTTLDTIGLETFDGQLPSCTFTAHPKLDPLTKELVCFGYEAKGDGTPDVCYMSIGPDGKFTETVWLISPVVAMIHDFAVTENWVIFPLIPLTCDPERLKAGGEHWQWNPDIPFYIGVLPRRGASGSDVKWFRSKNVFAGHTSNAYETPNGKIIFDLPVSDQNVFFWWPDKAGHAPEPHTISSHLTRYTIDPRATDLDLPPPERLSTDDTEFYKIDDRFLMREHSHCFFDVMKPGHTDFPAIAANMGGGYPPYNGIGNMRVSTGSTEYYLPGSKKLCQEPVFLPRPGESTAEGDGWIIVLVNNYENMGSELHIVDTRNMAKAQAVVELPLRLRPGLHGNWVDATELPQGGHLNGQVNGKANGSKG